MIADLGTGVINVCCLLWWEPLSIDQVRGGWVCKQCTFNQQIVACALDRMEQLTFYAYCIMQHHLLLSRACLWPATCVVSVLHNLLDDFVHAGTFAYVCRISDAASASVSSPSRWNWVTWVNDGSSLVVPSFKVTTVRYPSVKGFVWKKYNFKTKCSRIWFESPSFSI